jgi:NTE family protein
VRCWKRTFTQALTQIQALAPECQQITNDIAALETKRIVAQNRFGTAGPGEKAALAAQLRGLSDQIAQKRLALAKCTKVHPSTMSPQRVNLLEAAMASASIPFAFPPIKLGSGRPESYVDGGVREVIPIQAALEAGANEVFAVVASATGVPPATTFPDHKPLNSFENSNMLDIAQRVAMDIMPDETSVNEIDPPPTGWGAAVTVIQPKFDIHDIMTIDPGLIRINIAYGYMRADDVLQAKSRDPNRYREVADQFSEERKTNQIIQLRKQIWDMENLFHGSPPLIPPMPSALPAVRQLKRDLMGLVNKRRDSGGAVPAGADSWSQDWEKHKWTTRLSLWIEAAGDPMGYAGAGGEARVVYRGNDDHIHELFLDSTRNWSAADLFTVNASP